MYTPFIFSYKNNEEVTMRKQSQGHTGPEDEDDLIQDLEKVFG